LFMLRKFFFFFALTFLSAAFLMFVRHNSKVQQIFGNLFPTPTPKVMNIKGIGVIGDSQSDEYRGDDARGYQYAPTTLNWIEQLVKSRGLNFGSWNMWGDVRRTGFAYNWSRTSATTESVIVNGQHTGLSEQIRNGEVNIAIVYIGANDFFPMIADSGYSAIYNGTLQGKALDEKIQLSASNIDTVIKTLQEAGRVKTLLLTVPDWNLSAAVRVAYQNETGRQRVSNAIAQLNAKIQHIANKRKVSIFDINVFYKYVLSDAPLGSITVGGESVNIYIPGDEPHYAFLSDGVHPGTIMQGLFANALINQMNKQFYTNIQPLSEREILGNAGLL
jgi:phospholipase/lecithinase/hemolysin